MTLDSNDEDEYDLTMILLGGRAVAARVCGLVPVAANAADSVDDRERLLNDLARNVALNK